jgi:hypothetical protein
MEDLSINISAKKSRYQARHISDLVNLAFEQR